MESTEFEITSERNKACQIEPVANSAEKSEQNVNVLYYIYICSTFFVVTY